MRRSIKPLLTPFKPPPSVSGAATLRRLSAEPHLSPPSPASSDPSNPISQTISLLQTTDPNDWKKNPNFPTLLASLPPHSFLKITRQLPNYQNALQFFNHLNTTSTATLQPDSISFAFQAVLEHAMRDHPESTNKLNELFALSKDQNVPLSVNAASLLIKRFGQEAMVNELTAVFDAVDPESKNTHLFNLVLEGLLKSGKADDAFKLLDEMLEPNSTFPPDENTVSIFLSSILTRNWSGRSLGDGEISKLVLGFGEHGIIPNSIWLTRIIMRFCRNGNCDKAWDMLHKVMDMGCEVGPASCNALLTGLAKERDFEKMNSFMVEMKENGIRPDVITIGIMINHLCKFRRVNEALEVFEKMRDQELGIEPDVVTFNTLIDGLCKVGRQEEGLKLMERMNLDNKCKPNTITYNCLIDGFCKAGEIDKARELFDQMENKNVEPNVITLNTMLDGMCKNGRVSTGMKFFTDMRDKNVKGNKITYTILITAFCKANNIEKAFKLFEEMLENNCSPDSIVYYSLISGLTQAGRMDDASFIVSKMNKAGFDLDIVSYNVMINGFCKKNKLERASEIIKDMEKSGVKPDRVTYNTLISHFCAKGNFKHANRVMKKMINDGFMPNIVTYGALIQAYCWSSDLVSALKIFRDMGSSSKVVPNTVVYNMLIDALCKNGDVEVAISLMGEMEETGVKPNATTYNALFKGLRDRNWVEKVMEFMDRMTEQRCNPDYVTMEILTEWLSAVGETEKLREFVRGRKVSSLNA